MSKVYGQCSRDMRRLGRFLSTLFGCTTECNSGIDSVSRSPLYSMYGETIAGVPVVRAFGAGSKFLRDMISCVDTVRSLVVRFEHTLNMTSLLEH